MPASRSPSRGAEAAPGAVALALADDLSSGLRPFVAAIVAALPASIVAHFLPPGSASPRIFPAACGTAPPGKSRVTGRDAGALEWRLHPASLLGMALSADVHWVKVGFVIDAAVKVDRHGFAAHDVKGGGPIEDLREPGGGGGMARQRRDPSQRIAGQISCTVASRPPRAISKCRISRRRKLPTARTSGATIFNSPKDSPAPTAA